MKLYMTASTDEAQNVVQGGFTGRPQWLLRDDGSREIAHFVEFRDTPPTGWSPSRTAETSADLIEDTLNVVIDGSVHLDYLGDFTLVIDVPDDLARSRIARDEEPIGWPFEEVWLTPDEANQHRHTLIVLDEDGEPVRPDLIGR